VARDRQAVPRAQAAEAQPVDDDVGLGVGADQREVQLAVGVQHDRAIGQGLAADRRDHDAQHRGRQDRSTRGERVGRGARGRGQDQAVRAVVGDPGVADRQGQAQHRVVGAPGADRVVERDGAAHALVALQGDPQPHARLDHAAAGEHVLQDLLPTGDRRRGQEAHRAQVDPEGRHRRGPEGAHRGEDRAVAAEDHHQVRWVLGPTVFQALLLGLGERDHVGLDVDPFDALPQPGLDRQQQFGGPRLARVGQDQHAPHAAVQHRPAVGVVEEVLGSALGHVDRATHRRRFTRRACAAAVP
jgi:hypothetical protein